MVVKLNPHLTPQLALQFKAKIYIIGQEPFMMRSKLMENSVLEHKDLGLREGICGWGQEVPLLDGTLSAYVNLDNAASTPAFSEVMETITNFMPFYSSVHRGTGFKSRLSTVAYDEAHEIIARFVGADPETNTVIFGKNTTEAINKLAFRLGLAKDSVVITSRMEHHSNDLPWRKHAKVVHVEVTPEGRLDEDDFDHKLQLHAGKVALVAISGASNVTGFINPVHRLARKAHQAGALILVDAAQLVPHRQVDMKADNDPEHLDFVAIAAHKMYAPFGTGALIGPKQVFLKGSPEYPGGGTVQLVTRDEVYWADLPDREEAGSPNVVGAIAMAAAAKVLMRVGMQNVALHERELLEYALDTLKEIPGMTIYGESDPAKMDEKVGVIPFNLAGLSHFLVAAILGYEGGIGVRSGCFCAQPYVLHLLNISCEDEEDLRAQILSHNKTNMPGLVRMSFGCYNNREDIDKLGHMLHRIVKKEYQGVYELEPRSGEYLPKSYVEPLPGYFSLNNGFSS